MIITLRFHQRENRLSSQGLGTPHSNATVTATATTAGRRGTTTVTSIFTGEHLPPLQPLETCMYEMLREMYACTDVNIGSCVASLLINLLCAPKELGRRTSRTLACIGLKTITFCYL
ncbi:hypothetical protein QVD17_28755 [Tagetes erecta]|uniref:Uncharacterized protein n=1 Tax=Tagetes erecta TaxID=13708 RepID=A0AAD8KB60_TARER|nr:hypothetical protein QVD17_28755 [Tagetes erecta]